MEEDIINGWEGALPGEFWLCPKCNKVTPVKDWREFRPGCDLCGDHDGRQCPNCDAIFDHVWDANEIKAPPPQDPS